MKVLAGNSEFGAIACKFSPVAGIPLDFGHVPSEKALKPLAEARLAGEPHDEEAYAALVTKEARLGHWSVALVGIALLAMTTFRLFA